MRFTTLCKQRKCVHCHPSPPEATKSDRDGANCTSSVGVTSSMILQEWYMGSTSKASEFEDFETQNVNIEFVKYICLERALAI